MRLDGAGASEAPLADTATADRLDMPGWADALRDGVLLVHEDDRVVACNRRAAELLGRPEAEVQGRAFGSILEDADGESAGQLLARARQSMQRQRIELRRDGRFVELSVDPLPSTDGRPARAVCLLRDVTDARRETLAIADEAALDATLADLASEVLAARSVERVVELVLGAAQFLTDSAQGTVGFVDRSSAGLVVRIPGGAGMVEGLPRGRSALAQLPSWCADVVLGPTRVLREAPDDRAVHGPTDGAARPTPKRLLAVPVTSEGETIALVVVAGAPRPYSDADATRIERLCAVFGLAIERAQAAVALEQSEQRYRTLVDNQGEGIGIVDPTESFVYANPAGERVFGVGPGELVGRNLREFTDPAAFTKVRDETETRRAGNRSTYELDILRPDGTRRTLLVTATPRHDADGTFIGTFGIFRDVTERRRAEATVRVSEARSRALYELGQREFATESELVEQALDAAVGLTRSEMGYFHFVHPNGAAVELFAWSSAMREQCRIDAQGHYPVSEAGLWAESVRRGEPVIHNDVASEPARKGFPEGHPEVRRHLGMPVRDRDVTVAVAGVGNKELPYDETDVVQLRLFLDGVWKLVARRRAEVEHKALQQQLQVAQKMEAVGQLAGGVAHDFNNLLAAINGYADILLEDLPTESPLREDVDQIRRAGERGAALVRQLLTFGRRQVVMPTALSLNDVVESMAGLLRRLIGEDVDLVARLEPDLGHVLADYGQIEQILMNLASNARDAMPLGGTLTIETRNVELTAEGHPDHVGLEPGLHVALTVSDTGSGMDESTRARLFEPFFTTKAPGKGTGLGLSTVYGIVQMCNGSTAVRSALGSGTTFEVLFPRLEHRTRRARRLPRIARPRGGNEALLLVEDEEAVRRLAERILGAAGYEVLSAGDGAEALELSETRRGPIQLLVADVVMPGMSGPELAKQLRAARPGLQVLFMSGYTDDAIGHHGVLDPAVQFLPKPFTAADLLARVRELLDAPASEETAPSTVGGPTSR